MAFLCGLTKLVQKINTCFPMIKQAILILIICVKYIINALNKVFKRFMNLEHKMYQNVNM